MPCVPAKARFNEDMRLLRERKAADVGKIQDAQARLQEIAVEAGQLSAPELAAAAAASSIFSPAQAPSEDDQGPVTVTVCHSCIITFDDRTTCLLWQSWCTLRSAHSGSFKSLFIQQVSTQADNHGFHCFPTRQL